MLFLRKYNIEVGFNVSRPRTILYCLLNSLPLFLVPITLLLLNHYRVSSLFIFIWCMCFLPFVRVTHLPRHTFFNIFIIFTTYIPPSLTLSLSQILDLSNELCHTSQMRNSMHFVIQILNFLKLENMYLFWYINEICYWFTFNVLYISNDYLYLNFVEFSCFCIRFVRFHFWSLACELLHQVASISVEFIWRSYCKQAFLLRWEVYTVAVFTQSLSISLRNRQSLPL